MDVKEKMDKLFSSMFRTKKTSEEPPAPTKEDYERKFKIDFDSNDEPVFTEVKDED